jgi:hypothetical protein
MENFYFTFGTSHTLVISDGNGFIFGEEKHHKMGTQFLHNFWVRVVAENYNEARTIFVDEFASKYLETKMSWSFQYEEKNFRPRFFKSGELICISKTTKNQ